jgi:hypothetical protein
MRVSDLRNDAGLLTGFSVSRLLLGRTGARRIVAAIPGCKVVRRQGRFKLSGRDDFCEFAIDGKTFLVIEPFGDNSRYWVVADPPEAECPQLARVRDAFQRHRVFGLFAV